MKHKLIFAAAALAVAAVLGACSAPAPAASSAPSASPAAAGGNKETDTLEIIATIFPEYDWTDKLLGDNPANAELTILQGSGVDLHSYQPTAADMMKIATCDLFIYVGGESDQWVEEALRNSSNPDRVVLNLMDTLGDRIREEEVVEGMQEDHAQEELRQEADEEGHEHHSGETEYDEHIWLSLRNASVCCESIAGALSELDPEHADTYAANLKDYQAALSRLDADYEKTVSEGSFHTLLFGDRFPFRYLVDDYGLDYYAAFVGCSAETEASFETITFLAAKTDELSLPCVLTIEGTDHRIADTIVQNTANKNRPILTMNSLQSVTAEDISKGVSYLTIMEENRRVLEEALQ